MAFHKSQTKWKLYPAIESMLFVINYFELSVSTPYPTKFHLNKNSILFLLQNSWQLTF